MPVIARYEFDDLGTEASDSALGNGAQNGLYTDGAQSVDGRAVLDGIDDKIKFRADEFQMPRGTLEIQFSQTAHVGDGPNTILSRDSVGDAPNGYRAEVLADGSIRVTHEGPDGDVTFQTEAGFMAPGDEIRLSYSWDETGPGALQIDNLTQETGFGATVPAGLTMDQGEFNQNWMVGTGQSQSQPWMLDNLGPYFNGSVDYFELSDTVDNIDPDPVRDGIVYGTPGDDLIDTSYVDTDGDVIDGEDAIIPGDGPNDDRVYAGDGNDTVYAGEGSDTVYGGNGDDLIETGNSRPLPDRDYPGLYPADSDPNDDRDLVYGGAGNDTIRTGDDADTIFGGTGNDYIDGGIDDDVIHGERGNDTIIGGEGSDTIYGGQGDDLIYGGLSPAFPDELNIRDDEGDLRPDNGRDLINAGWGDDTVYGMDDNDTINGGMGNDLLFGGIDDDLVNGGWGDDTLHGDQGNDTLNGQLGDDLIYGGDGDDVIRGGLGNDTIIGGPGADTMYGGSDRDLFIINRPTDGIGDYINGNEGGDDYDTLDLTGAGPLRITYDTNPENGIVTFLDRDGNETGTLTFRNIEHVIPCFTPGTLIATPRGEVPVEDLRSGDKVVTRDNGIREIAWTGAKHMDWAALCANPHMKPVLIRQGSLGNGLPERDMMVSPNHRMLVANDRTALYFEDHEVLVAAKHLIGGKGVRSVDAMGVTYHHFMFQQHEVVLANGAWTESFQPGDYTLKGMGNAQRQEILELFPELATATGLSDYQAARRTLKKHEAALLVR